MWRRYVPPPLPWNANHRRLNHHWRCNEGWCGGAFVYLMQINARGLRGEISTCEKARVCQCSHLEATMMARRWITSVSALAMAALLAWDTASAQQTTGVPGSPDATTTIDGRQLPPRDSAVWWLNQRKRGSIEAVLAGARGPAERCSQHPSHHDGRCGLRSTVNIRRGHPHSSARQDCRYGAAVYQFPYHLTLLADPRGAYHRPEPSLSGFRCHLRTVHGLPGLQQHHSQRRDDDRPDLLENGYRTSWFGKDHNTPGLCGEPGRTLRPVADRNGL